MMAIAVRPTVLVVDDEPDIREIARVFLEIEGFDVVGEASDGAEGIQQFLALAPPPKPTVILLDNRMPVISGLEAAREILTHHPEQLIVLFTAYDSDDIRHQARDLGIAAVVSKSQASKLPTILRRLLDDEPTS